MSVGDKVLPFVFLVIGLAGIIFFSCTLKMYHGPKDRFYSIFAIVGTSFLFIISIIWIWLTFHG